MYSMKWKNDQIDSLFSKFRNTRKTILLEKASIKVTHNDAVIITEQEVLQQFFKASEEVNTKRGTVFIKQQFSMRKENFNENVLASIRWQLGEGIYH